MVSSRTHGLARALATTTLLYSAFFFVPIPSVNAAMIDIVGSVDTVSQSLSNPNPPDLGQVGVGGTATSAGLATILFYELPQLQNTDVIQSAYLSLTLLNARNLRTDGQVPTSFNVDLYTLGTRALNQIIEPGDYGDGDRIPASATLITDNWWVAGDNSQIGLEKTADISTAVISAYSSGLQAGNFLVFALYADIPLDLNNYTTYKFGIDTTATLSVSSVVPVPGTALLFGSGMLSLLTFARRKARYARVGRKRDVPH